VDQVGEEAGAGSLFHSRVLILLWLQVASDDKDGKEAAAAMEKAEKKPLQWKLLEPWEIKQKIETYEVRRALLCNGDC
jgi:hypothetical protein